MTLCAACAAPADVPDPDPARFASEIAAFAAWDRKNAVPENSLLFVGSSSIRLWPTAEAFPDRPIINRGFGGSELSDVIHFYAQVIDPYGPSAIFLYAGDNDVAAGKDAQQVFADYKELVGMITADLPTTRVVFISIKPSTARWSSWPEMVAANRLIRDYANKYDNLEYADLATPLLDENGEPGDYFVADGLHLNERGYALWQQALAAYLGDDD